jgi:hypothetical protein
MRVIQEDAEVAGRLPADISKVIEICCQDLSLRVARLERSNEVQREREQQRLLQIEAIREQVTKYIAAKGKGNNADLMRVKQRLPNLVAKYMKNLETDEKDGLSSDIIETWKEAALDIARDALEYLNHFGGDPGSRPDDALGPLRKAIGKVAALAEAVTKGVQEPDEEELRDLARKLGTVKKEIMAISRSLVVGQSASLTTEAHELASEAGEAIRASRETIKAALRGRGAASDISEASGPTGAPHPPPARPALGSLAAAWAPRGQPATPEWPPQSTPTMTTWPPRRCRRGQRQEWQAMSWSSSCRG